jgi:hypothetical protein
VQPNKIIAILFQESIMLTKWALEIGVEEFLYHGVCMKFISDHMKNKITKTYSFFFLFFFLIITKTLTKMP